MKRREVDATPQPVTRPLPRMMIGFIVRRCTVELGHPPTATEFAAWANAHGDESHPHCLFGRAITEDEAALILKHQSRLVSAKSARPDEEYVPHELVLPADGKVVPLAAARAKARSR